MSYKTSFKRVALVAVAALTIGGFSAVSAFAVVSADYTSTTGTVTPATPLAGTAVTIPFSLSTTLTSSVASVATYTATLSSSPTGSASTISSNVTGQSASYATAGASTTQVTASSNTLVATAGATAVAVTTALAGNFVFTPDVAGSYTVHFAFAATTGTPTSTTLAPDVVVTVVAPASDLKLTNATTITYAGSASPYTVTGSQTAGASNFVTLTTPASTLAIVITGSVGNVVTGTGATGTGTANINTNGVATVFNVPTTVGGTLTIKSYPITGGAQSATASSTVTITVSALSGVTYSYSTVAAAVLTGTSISQEVSGATLATAVAGTNAESWVVSQKDSSGTTLSTAASTAITASIVGVGAIKISGGTSGGYATLAAGSAQVGSAGVSDTVTVLSDGRAGNATVTITVNGVTVLSKTLTFYGAVAAISAVANKSVLATNFPTTTAATITATDAAGTLVPYVAVGKFSAVSSSTSVLLNSGSYAEDATTTYGGHGNYTATVTTGVLSASGQTATITYTYTSGTTVINAAPVAFTLGGSASTVTFAFDKTTYAPGTAAIITVTAKDSAGNPAASGTVVSANAITSNLAASGLPNTALLASQNGVATLKVFAPGTAGTWIITDASNVITGGAVTATASVTADGTLAASIQAALDAANAAADAAAEATDAANAATDAANAAADAADSATAAAQDAADQAGQALAAVNTLATSVAVLIAGIKAQLTSVTNLVIKLIKRVAKLPIKK
jgi:hypothetical protein